MTQFVRGALTRARQAGARIIFVTCDPAHRAADVRRPDDRAGRRAEVIAGSTRLKAGTATKLVLNMLTTGAMVRIGKTYGNLMVDVQTGSEKLKDRARRIVNIVTGLEYDEADKLLNKADWNVKAAIVMQKTGLTLRQGAARAAQGERSMREAIGEDIEPRLAATHRRLIAQTPVESVRYADRSSITVDVRVQLQERRRQLRRHRPASISLDRVAFASPVAISTIASRAEDRRHPHRQRLARHVR